VTATSTIEPVKQLEVKGAAELAEFYHVPKPLMNLFVIQFGDTLYPKEPFLLYLGHQKGIQRIQIEQPHQENGEWRTKASIYPRITTDMIEAVAKLPEDHRKAMLDYLTAPTEEWGHASTSNVRMSTMHQWLPEIAIKRAVCRALRLFVGIGVTAYEELPEVVVESKDLQEAKSRVTQDDKSKRSLPVSPAKPPTTQPAWTDTTASNHER